MDVVGQKTLETMDRARSYNAWLFALVESHLGTQTLEVGSGTGTISKLLAARTQLTGIDINPDYIEILTRSRINNAQFGAGNIETGKYFFGDKQFDSIVCMNVLEHIKNDKQALSNMYKLLKPGGKLFLLVPAHASAYGPLDRDLGHFRRYDKKMLSKTLTDSGFAVLRTFYINLMGLFGWWFNGRVLGKSDLPSNQLMVFDRISQPFLALEGLIRPPIGLSVVAIATK